MQTFGAHDYDAVPAGWNMLVFEKKATGWNKLAYGNWVDDIPLYLRVKASILPAGEETFRLECQAFMVRDRGSATEEDIKLGKSRSRPYQEILEEVAARLRPK